MDYSSLPNDPDHPVGTSPWQSSPQANHQSFAPDAGSAPSSPLAKHSAPDHAESPRQSEDGTEDIATSTSQGSPRAIPDRGRGQPLNGEGQAYSHPPQYPQQHQRPHPGTPYQQPQQQPRSAVPSRYHTGIRQNQRLPQYKLQAKITGLERTGRKDPILRFDVHVGLH